MAKAQAPAGTPGFLAKVVIGIDDTDVSLHAVKEVAPLVAALEGEVVVVFVRHIPVMTEATAAEAGEAIVLIENSLDELEKTGESDAASVLDPLGIKWTYVIKNGDPAREILAVAEDVGATAVCVGSTLHGAIGAFLISSVTEHLMHHCKLPLLVIRPSG